MWTLVEVVGQHQPVYIVMGVFQHTRLPGIDSRHLAMNGTALAVGQLDIELGKHIRIEDTCFGIVPDGRASTVF